MTFEEGFPDPLVEIGAGSLRVLFDPPEPLFDTRGMIIGNGGGGPGTAKLPLFTWVALVTSPWVGGRGVEKDMILESGNGYPNKLMPASTCREGSLG